MNKMRNALSPTSQGFNIARERTVGENISQRDHKATIVWCRRGREIENAPGGKALKGNIKGERETNYI
jgi:hypothetical protein